MKKLFTFIAIAAVAVACCNNQQPAATLSVEKFFENPTTLVEQETTITDVLQNVTCCGCLVIGTAEQKLTVIPPAETKICKGKIGKEITVKGIIKEYVINEEELAKFEEYPDKTEECIAKLAEYKAKFEAEGAFVDHYYMEASEVTFKDCCKDKEGCCSKDKEGCKKECTKEEGKEGCCKDKEKKAE
jgi:hypothetical protein